MAVCATSEAGARIASDRARQSVGVASRGAAMKRRGVCCAGCTAGAHLCKVGSRCLLSSDSRAGVSPRHTFLSGVAQRHPPLLNVNPRPPAASPRKRRSKGVGSPLPAHDQTPPPPPAQYPPRNARAPPPPCSPVTPPPTQPSLRTAAVGGGEGGGGAACVPSYCAEDCQAPGAACCCG